MKLLCLVLFASAPVLFGNGIADVRATLEKMHSDTPLRARVEVTTRRSDGESDKQKRSQGINTVVVENGSGGLALSWTPEQIARSRKSAWEKAMNPDASKSNLATLTALEADDALNLLDAADPLRRWLDKAVLLEEKDDHYMGKPARLLLIRPDLKLNEEGRKAAKTSEAMLKLWINGDGDPLGVDREIKIKFSKFFLSYLVREHETREYQNAGGRLIVTHATHDSFGSGLGHSEESHSATTVTLVEAGPTQSCEPKETR